MAARSLTYGTRITRLAAAFVPVLLAACAVTSGAGAPADGATPTPFATAPGAATATRTSTEPSAAAETSAGPGAPVDYALWIDRQGFGGSSGLRQVLKGATWINEHAFQATVFDVEEQLGYADRLATWLDEHPAMPCWVEYHATVRATLERLLAGYAAARDARAAGHGIPIEIGETLVAEAQSAFDLPAPAGC